MKKRHFRYALAHWCLCLCPPKFKLPELCDVAQRDKLGLDLVPYADWKQVKNNDATLSGVLPDMGDLPPFVPGFNNPEHSERVYAAIDLALDRAAAAKIKFVLVFTGYDTGEDRDQQFRRIVDAFTAPSLRHAESLIKKAERLGITFVIEMLNTKGDAETWKGHPGYLGDDMVELVDKVVMPIGNANFKLAFDIYHLVMMGADPIEMIEEFHDMIGVVHVAGVMAKDGGGYEQTNRGELTLEGQAIDYAAVGALLAKYLPAGTWVLLEYIPTQVDPATVRKNLRAAIDLVESKMMKNVAAA